MDIVHYVGEYRYAALLLAALAEGPVTAFAAGSLIATGVLNPFYALSVLIFKDLVLDSAFFGIGRLSHVPRFAARIRRLKEGVGLTARLLRSVEEGWHTHPVRLMWIGKLAYGLSAWFLVSAGIAGVPWGKFYLYNVPVSLFQFGVLLTLGWSLGTATWGSASQALFWAQLCVAAIALYFGIRWLGRLLRERFEAR